MNQREQEFQDKLFALLREYNVEMTVEESVKGYYTSVDGINFHGYQTYDREGNEIEPAIDITLGTWENGK